MSWFHHPSSSGTPRGVAPSRPGQGTHPNRQSSFQSMNSEELCDYVNGNDPRSRSLIKRLYSGADHLLHPQYNGVRDSNTLVFSNSDDDLSVHPGYEIRIAMDAVKNMLNAYTQENPKRISVTTITDETKAPRHLSTAVGSRQQDVLNVVVDEMKSPNGTFVEFSSIRDIPIEFSAKFGLLRQEFEARLGHELDHSFNVESKGIIYHLGPLLGFKGLKWLFLQFKREPYYESLATSYRRDRQLSANIGRQALIDAGAWDN